MGVALAYTADIYIRQELEAGTLVTTLDDFAPKSSGFLLYFAAGSQNQPKLRASLETLLAFLSRIKARATTAGRPLKTHTTR
jgi:DNA-binding transcriptional LysR family regulator